MEKSQRKRTRLKDYDYSQNGIYFVTICTDRRKDFLSQITVGQGLAPAESRLTVYGKILEEQLSALENRYSHIKIDNYVIMPNHIHILLAIQDKTAGASPRPTLSDIICAYKSIAARQCRRNGFMGKIFQISFYDHIIRNQKDYQKIWEYIDANPMRWKEDRFYCG